MTYQINAPLLDACVLGIVSNEDAYGYTLTQKTQQVVDISESTLYPVLRRLQKSEFLTTYDVPYQGRNRRYYAITEKGKEILTFYRDEWEDYKRRIDELINAADEEADSEGAIEQKDKLPGAIEQIEQKDKLPGAIELLDKASETLRTERGEITNE